MGRAVVGVAGIEPATSCSQSRRAPAALHPDYCTMASRIAENIGKAYMKMISASGGIRKINFHTASAFML